MELRQRTQLLKELIDITKLVSVAVALLLVSVTSAQANDIPICEKGDRGSISPPPSHKKPKDCRGVTGGYGYRNDNLVDCKGRIVCKLPEGTQRVAGGMIGRPIDMCTRNVLPRSLGRACIVYRRDGNKTYLVNKCSCDLNIKWTDNICATVSNERYPCNMSIESRGRELRTHTVIDRGLSREDWPNYGTIESVACKNPSFPYEDSHGRVVCR